MTDEERDAESEGARGIGAGMNWISQQGILEAELRNRIESIDIERDDLGVIVAAFLDLVYPKGEINEIDIFEADELDVEGRSMMTSYICGFIGGAQEALKGLKGKPLH